MYGDVRSSAERTVRMGYGTIRMSVRHLYSARNRHQNEADQSQEYSPRRSGSVCLASSNHTIQLYRRARQR